MSTGASWQGWGRSGVAVAGGGLTWAWSEDKVGQGFEKIYGVNPQDWTYRSPESSGLGRSHGLQTDFSQRTLCSGELLCRNPVSHATTWVNLQTGAERKQQSPGCGHKRQVGGCRLGALTRTFQGVENVPHLHCGGYLAIQTCQNSSNCPLKTCVLSQVEITACKAK